MFTSNHGSLAILQGPNARQSLSPKRWGSTCPHGTYVPNAIQILFLGGLNVPLYGHLDLSGKYLPYKKQKNECTDRAAWAPKNLEFQAQPKSHRVQSLVKGLGLRARSVGLQPNTKLAQGFRVMLMYAQC